MRGCRLGAVAFEEVQLQFGVGMREIVWLLLRHHQEKERETGRNSGPFLSSPLSQHLLLRS
jgi:hypothetical protein